MGSRFSAYLHIAVDSLGRARSHELHTKEINRNCLADIANEIAIERECQVYVRPFAYEDPTIVIADRIPR
jgi:hypothetical protein